jgi:hypothetical protein
LSPLECVRLGKKRLDLRTTATYCRTCFGIARLDPWRESHHAIYWVAKCDRCLRHEAEDAAKIQQLEDLWRARECAADDCQVVFTPAATQQRFCSDRCRRRTNARAKAETRRGVR